MAQVLDPASSNGEKIVQIFKDLDVAMYDNENQLKSGYELLGGLAEKWDDLDGNTQKYIATTLAGTTQLNNFLALMNNFEHAIEATNTALESQDSALNENAAYMESIEAKMSQLSSTFQDFANNVISDDLVKNLLDFANGLLQIANTDFGRVVTQILLLTSLGWGATSLVNAMGIFSAIGNQFKTFFSVFNQVASGATTLIGALTGVAEGATVMSGALSVSLPILLAIAAAIGVGGAIWNATSAYRENVDELTSDIEANTQKIQANKERLEEINGIPWESRSAEIADEKEALEEENAILQEQIEKYEKIRAKKITGERTIVTGPQAYRVSLYKGTDKEQLLEAESYEQIYKELEKIFKDDAVAFSFYLQQVEKGTQSFTAQGDELNNKLIPLLNEYERTLEDGGQLSDVQKDNVETAKQLVEYYQELAENGEKLSDSQKALISAYSFLNADLEESNYLAQGVATSYALTDDEVKKLLADYPALGSAIDSVNGKNYVNINTLANVKGATAEETKAMYEAVAALTVFNNTNLDASQKLNELSKLAIAAGVSGELIANAIDPKTQIDRITGYIGQGMSYKEAKNAFLSDMLPSIWQKWIGSVDFNNIPGSGTGTGAGAGSGSGGTKSSQTKEKTAIEQSTEAWKEQLSLLKDRLELLEKSGAEEQQQIEMMRQIQEAIHAQANKYRALGLSEDSEQVRQLKILWWDYQNDIDSIYSKIEEAAKEAVEKQAEEARKAAEELRQAWLDSLNKLKESYEAAANYMVDNIDNQIEALQKQRSKEEEYWNDKINALNEQNDALEDQIKYENLLDELTRAKQKKLYVFKDGQFQYVEDVEAISTAQANLDAYERAKALEDETARLEKARDRALAAIDDQIEGWQEYRDEWANVTQEYTKQQNKLLAEQLLGINAEQKNWQTRLANAKQFAKDYAGVMSEISSVENMAATAGDIDGGYTGGGISGSDLAEIEQAKRDWANATTDAEREAAHNRAEAIRNKYGYSGGADGSEYIPKKFTSSSSSSKKSNSSSKSGILSKISYSLRNTLIKGLAKHADGTLSANSGLSIVGEQGPELRVLGSGDGIIPADVTKNLWTWGQIDPGILTTQGNTQVFNIDNLSLPNVKDAESLVTGLKQMAYQRAYKRA